MPSQEPRGLRKAGTISAERLIEALASWIFATDVVRRLRERGLTSSHPATNVPARHGGTGPVECRSAHAYATGHGETTRRCVHR